jgi:HD-GYP domain-containing protein (c-di-GMP phosphodiesterase class II)
MSDRQLEQESAVNGPQFVLRLSALIRIARIYDVSNQAFKKQLQNFSEVILEAMEKQSELALVAVADYLYVNGVRIRADASLLSVYHALLGELSSRAIGGIRFHQGVEVAELEKFFQLFVSAEDPQNPERLFQAVADARLEHVELLKTRDVDADEIAHRLEEQMHRTGGRGGRRSEGEPGEGGGGLSAERGRAKRTFSQAVTGTRRVVQQAIKTGKPDLRFAKRLIQPVVDNIMKNEYSIVGLTALKSHDEYTYAHCVNVSTLSVGMGHVMGMPRQTLADLGVAALVHDIGKIRVPGDVLRKPAKLTDEEWRLMRRHPLEGMKMMIRMPGLSSLALDSMRTALEHHMGANLKGYPKTEAGWQQAPMSRIVALADCFDAMTAHRAYRKRPFTQYEALRRLLGPDKEQFDPTVRWALIRVVGLYPPGTLLQVDSGHVVLALSPNPEDPRRPNCKVLVRPDGTPPPDDQPENWDPMPADRRVTKVLKPEDITTINVDEHLSAF